MFIQKQKVDWNNLPKMMEKKIIISTLQTEPTANYWTHIENRRLKSMNYSFYQNVNIGDLFCYLTREDFTVCELHINYFGKH